MAWTREAPTVAGWYFVQARGELSGKKFVTVVKVYTSRIFAHPHILTGYHPNVVFWDGDNVRIDDDRFVCWWSEAIQPPPVPV